MQAITDATELLSRIRHDLAVVSEQQRVGARLMGILHEAEGLLEGGRPAEVVKARLAYRMGRELAAARTAPVRRPARGEAMAEARAAV